MIDVLYDGWSWIYAPNSPAALHLLALLSNLPPGVQAQVALPGEPPAWFPPGARPQIQLAPDTPRARLAWEQRRLTQLAGQLGCALLHLVSPTPALFGRARTVASPAGFWEADSPTGPRGFFDRLRASAARGGMARLGTLLWPTDLPLEGASAAFSSGAGAQVERLPPLAFPGLHAPQAGLDEQAGLDLPECYVLYHGPDHPAALRRLLEIWSWPAGPVGEGCPLVLLGLGEPARQRLPVWLAEFNLARTVRTLPLLPPNRLAAVYRSCTALLHPLPVSPWGDPVRLALACGKPVVAADGPLADALVGPAAYLLPRGDARALGAALITTIVEESVAERLSRAARQRAAAWDSAAFGPRLLAVYQNALK